jgi:hypothetical protein
MKDELFLWEHVQSRFRTVNMPSAEFAGIISSTGRKYYNYENALTSFYSTDFLNILAERDIFSHNLPIQKKKDYFQCSNTNIASSVYGGIIPLRIEVEYFDTVGIPCVYKTAWYTKMCERHNSKSVKELYKAILEECIHNESLLGTIANDTYSSFCARRNCFSIIDLPEIIDFDKKMLELLITGMTNYHGSVPYNRAESSVGFNLLAEVISHNEKLQIEYNEERNHLIHESVIMKYNNGFFFLQMFLRRKADIAALLLTRKSILR